MKFTNEVEQEVITFKLSSGEELIARVLEVQNEYLVINDPVSVAPGPQGLGLVPSMFTANPKAEVRLNINSISIWAKTDDAIEAKYLEATTGIKLPEKKKLILG